MGRFIPLALVLLALLATAAASLVPWVSCPDCPYDSLCIRCRGRSRITLMDSRRCEPLHPVLARLLKTGGATAPIAGDLAEKHGRPRREVMGWIDNDDFFCYADTTLVEGPEGPIVLTVLFSKASSASEGSPFRVLLFDRNGRELDRRDISMPGELGLYCSLQKKSPVSVLIKPLDLEARSAGTVKISSGNADLLLARPDWPQNWEDIGIARIVSREGRLEVIPP